MKDRERPNLNDVIGFVRLALHRGQLEPTDVRRWADELLVQDVEPAMWMIDLSLVADRPTAETILDEALTGEVSSWAIRMLVALGCHRWIAAGISNAELAARLPGLGPTWHLPEDDYHRLIGPDILYEDADGVATGRDKAATKRAYARADRCLAEALELINRWKTFVPPVFLSGGP